MDNVVIRSLEGPEEFRLLEQAQAAIWGPADAVPYHQTMAASRYGGVAAGAFAGPRMVGFVFGFAAWDGRKVWLHSHMLGVLPDYRRSGLGARLKWAQRDLALAKGYDLMTWTYDPLEAVNAHLNLHRLGGTVRTFLPNYYGQMTDTLNRGLPSDRMLLEWALRSPRVEARAAGEPPVPDLAGVPPALELAQGTDGHWPAPAPCAGPPSAPRCTVPVPWSFQELKRHSPDLALRWRTAAGDALRHCLGRGWVAVDFAPPAQRQPGALGHYLLEKGAAGVGIAH